MKEKSRIWITLLPVIAVMVVIFCFSAQPADVSSKTSDGIAEKLMETVIPNYEKMSAESKLNIRDFVTYAVRKLGHLFEFFALGFFTFLHVHNTGEKREKKTKILWSAAFCLSYGASDEIHQIFVPGRFPRVTDVLIDTAGAVAGILVMSLIISIIHRRKNG